MRVLTVDVGNSSVHFGLFEGKKLGKEWRIAAESFPARRPADSRYRQIDKIIVSSVVPRLNKIIKKWFPSAVFVDHKNVGIKVRVKNPSEVGADRLVDALAAYKLYGGPAIIVDFGTATTFDVINGKGEYLGGAIAPGLLLACDTLFERTAKLPKIELKSPKNVIGKNTVEAMRSGLIFGYVAMVEGMVERLKSQLQTSNYKKNPKSKFINSKIKMIVTGGFAKLICHYTNVVDIIDDKLTLKGLRLISEL